jgi:hypothetical protein
MKRRELTITKESFSNIYGNEYLKGKYGPDWINIMVDNLRREGTTVKFITEKQVEAKKELESINKINL